MEVEESPNDIFDIIKDEEKEEFILNHTYTDIFNKIPIENTFNYVNNIFNQKNKEEIINKAGFCDTIKLKVILTYSYQKDYFEFNFPIKIFYNKERDKFQFLFNDIIDLIYSYANDKSIFLNENYLISYSTNNLDDNTFYFISKFPLDENIKYNIDVPLDGIIYIKLRKKISKIKSLRYEIFEDENEEEIDEAEEKDKNQESFEDNKNKKKDCKRSKEKRIGFIVKKVFEWKGLRKLSKRKMSLQEAAQNVNMSKKTLDEYYNQIKEGKKFGFDFNRYKRDKVNVLRGFVKKKKEGEKKEDNDDNNKKKKKVSKKNKDKDKDSK
jgi:hypothetical protein